ncbi:hypothetical protein BOTBODRAFT_175049 [Botryobasidium botryosum FD-172 SS1]|uniref:Peroxisomal ATPase PEX1 n=1 Tax=Botryobasidium botryosum (strain FD-172 SS1) TaxID=930990 RepID=A0A067MEF8_BOTB1|nr:hypothetical protein BOTBODRAFT_175049 [Botryobasidium botryosum FD-172 SS1]
MYGPLVNNGVRPQSLAVHLSTSATSSSPAKTAYVGWTGMTAASSLAQFTAGQKDGGTLETVEIDPQYASALGFAQGEIVEIGLLHDLPVAKSVATEPLSADDWEILELHAGYVEDNLLAQVRAAHVGQEIDVWVLGRTRVRFRVVSTNPPSPSNAVLLSTNTEVSIAPKLRADPAVSKDSTKGSKSSRTKGQRSSSKPKESAAEQQVPKISAVARVLPSRLFTPRGSVNDTESLSVYVSPSTFTRLAREPNPSPNSPPNRLRLVSLAVLHYPSTGNAPASAVTPHIPPVSTQTRTLHTNSDENVEAESSTNESGRSEDLFVLRCDRNVPERHAVIVGDTILDVRDWDIINLSAIPYGERGNRSPKASPHRSLAGDAHAPARSQHTLAGVDAILTRAHESIVRSFAIQGQYTQTTSSSLNASRVPGLLLCGAPGSGRTSIAKEIGKHLEEDPRVHAYTVYVDLAKYAEEREAAIKQQFQKWLDLALWHRPSILVLDNLDRVVGAEVEHANSSRQRQLAEHFISVLSSRHDVRGVVMLATCQSQTALHPLLSTVHTFATRVTLKAPGKDARRDIIARITESHFASSDIMQDPADSLNYVALATQTEGYSATDLQDLVGRAVHQAAIRASKGQPDQRPVLLPADFHAAQVDFTPLSLRDVKLQKSEVLWSDIGGLHETRRVLRETLEWPTKYGAIFAKCPLRLRSGLLLYGYPGCGKTLLASAVAKECGLNFISVKGPELLNKYIGASEKSVRDLFDRATAAKPCVLFFDEFDSIAPKRGHDSTGVTDRVVNQMLTQMDGAEGLDGVYVLAATSRPDLIDSALLRPGRLDKSLLCNMPDVDEREEILRAIGRKVKISESVNLKDYAIQTEGYSGADLQALVYNAHLEVIHSAISNSGEADEGGVTTDAEISPPIAFTSFGGTSGGGGRSRAEENALAKRMETILSSQQKTNVRRGPTATPKDKLVVQDEHLQRSLQDTRPSVPPEERRRLGRIYKEFVAERSGELPNPPEGGSVGARATLM